MHDRIGWVGLGGMGKPMAVNVARGGFGLTVCDLRPEPVARAGAARCRGRGLRGGRRGHVRRPVRVAAGPRPQRAGRERGVRGRGPARGLRELSTLSPATMRGFAARAAAVGVAFLDVPVSGNVRARTEGSLAVMAGGDPAAFERIRPVLDTIGANVFLLGPVGSGSVAKLANNLIGLTTLVTGRHVARHAQRARRRPAPGRDHDRERRLPRRARRRPPAPDPGATATTGRRRPRSASWAGSSSSRSTWPARSGSRPHRGPWRF